VILNLIGVINECFEKLGQIAYTPNGLATKENTWKEIKSKF